MDNKNMETYLNYNFNFQKESPSVLASTPYNLFYQRSNNNNLNHKLTEWDYILKDSNKESYKNFLKYPMKSSLLNSEVDGQHFKNALKHSFNANTVKKNFIGEK
jgi:hypothetical protein